MFPPLTPLSSLLLLPPTPSPLLALLRGCRGGCPRCVGRQGPGPLPGGSRVASGAERGGRGEGAGAAGPPAAARRGQGADFSHLPRRKSIPGSRGEEKRRERRSPGLGGGCPAARGSGGGGPRCVTFNRSLLCQRQQRQEGLATESGETVISCVESSRQSESFLGLSLVSGLVCARLCVCVSACLSARRSRPRAVHPKHRHPSSPPTPLPLPAPPQKSSRGAISGSGGQQPSSPTPARPAPLRAGVGGRDPPGRKLNTNK